MGERCYIIAEAGVNHNGDITLARQLIVAAKEAGADCVKFQTFKAKNLVTQKSPKAKYQTKVTDANESQFDMLKKLELNLNEFKGLSEYCKKVGIDFLSTPYNVEDVDLLDEIGVTGFKIASGQLTELPFLRYVASKKKTMIISTGMATMSDVFDAVECIRAAGNNDIIVLQCTTNYPSVIEDANIRAMKSIEEACKVRIGYSDHVPNNYACYAAVALGAEIVEKHFTLDKSLPGPDHTSSLNPQEFRELVDGIRNVENSLGDGIKRPTSIEKENIFGMKRSLVAREDMEAGTVLTAQLIGFKRPANGLPVNHLEAVIGKKLAKKLQKDEPIKLDSIAW